MLEYFYPLNWLFILFVLSIGAIMLSITVFILRYIVLIIIQILTPLMEIWYTFRKGSK